MGKIRVKQERQEPEKMPKVPPVSTTRTDTNVVVKSEPADDLISDLEHSTSPTTATAWPAELYKVKKEEEPLSEGDDWNLLAILPSIVLQDIFTRLDKDTLRNCRLVSKQWNNVIINSPNLIRRFLFTVNWNHVERLLSPSCYITVRVKHIQFNHSFKTPTQVEKLVTRIGPSVEKVILEYGPAAGLLGCTVNTSQNAILFSQLLDKCSKLEELEISTKNLHFISEITEAEYKSYQCCLKRLKLHSAGIRFDWQVYPVRRFVLSLASLSEVTFYEDYCNRFGQSVDFLISGIVNLLCEHLEKYPGCLKVINLEQMYSTSSFSYIMSKLVVASGNNNVDLHLPVDVELNEFLDYLSPPEIRRPADFQAIKTAKIVTNQAIENSSGLEFCTNLTQLTVQFARFGLPQKLHFFQNFSNLHTLKLQILGQLTFASLWLDQQNDDPALILHDGQIPPILPSIRSLQISPGIFQESMYARFHIAFPNLSKLVISWAKELPLDTFCVLAKLEKLEHLVIDGGVSGSDVTDWMILQRCQTSAHNTTEDLKLVPAITAFPKLKKLRFNFCSKLTDATLTNGIGLSETIEDCIFMAMRQMNFTDVGLEGATQSGTGRLKVNDMSDKYKMQFIMCDKCKGMYCGCHPDSFFDQDQD